MFLLALLAVELLISAGAGFAMRRSTVLRGQWQAARLQVWDPRLL